MTEMSVQEMVDANGGWLFGFLDYFKVGFERGWKVGAAAGGIGAGAAVAKYYA
ncbi:hypothetical protein [Hallella mizrahii]|uniref:hypothetical protein n=1 Tax=Hallella mizrahii TaxID=2606637 RepID=UPI0012B3811A|nr:hypothetical protein [Hallella mizrahii]